MNRLIDGFWAADFPVVMFIRYHSCLGNPKKIKR